ncbi:hypothetical protein FKO01_09965 [Mesorhizobium sp. B2-3-3]|nr:hypothetical protein FKO01_09965 [Mesorhizobium sp. B2-3-3]
MTVIVLEVAAIILPILGLVIFLSRNLETHQRLFVFIVAVILSAPGGFALYLWFVLMLFNGHSL